VVDGLIDITINLESRWRNVKIWLKIDYWSSEKIMACEHGNVARVHFMGVRHWKYRDTMKRHCDKINI